MTQIINTVFDHDTYFQNTIYHSSYQTVSFNLTDQKRIIIGISNVASCCEDWGLEVNIVNPDSILTPVTETNVTGWVVTNARWNDDNRVWRAKYENRRFDLPTATVLIETDHHPIEVVAWNNHDGYYPHSVYAEWFDHVDTQLI